VFSLNFFSSQTYQCFYQIKRILFLLRGVFWGFSIVIKSVGVGERRGVKFSKEGCGHISHLTGSSDSVYIVVCEGRDPAIAHLRREARWWVAGER